MEGETADAGEAGTTSTGSLPFATTSFGSVRPFRFRMVLPELWVSQAAGLPRSRVCLRKVLLVTMPDADISDENEPREDHVDEATSIDATLRPSLGVTASVSSETSVRASASASVSSSWSIPPSTVLFGVPRVSRLAFGVSSDGRRGEDGSRLALAQAHSSVTRPATRVLPVLSRVL